VFGIKLYGIGVAVLSNGIGVRYYVMAFALLYLYMALLTLVSVFTGDALKY
jgi:hypothetical protein